MSSKIITRFAPSPTGFLHIGGARTALFNWLYSRHCNGKFLLRVEDTDRKRSTEEATNAILESMAWLGLDADDAIIYQSKREARHAEIAHELLKRGKAYQCYATQEELNAFREANPNAKYQSPWRDHNGAIPSNIPPVIRLKAPKEGKSAVHDLVRGTVEVDNAELDDMVLLRSDGTPTYMLAVVVDDHDMAITDIIRGDDHFTNTFRQKQIYEAMDWEVPRFAHLPLIHGPDGAKLSKRHGALGVSEYQKMGYLPEALLNYLLRLGWSHGDAEIISMKDAINWFDIKDVGKSPSRFDFEKLNSVNAHYITQCSDQNLLNLIQDSLKVQPGSLEYNRILQSMPSLKPRASTLVELAEQAQIYIAKRSKLDDKSQKVLAEGGKELVPLLVELISTITDWSLENIEQICKGWASEQGLKTAMIMQTLRASVVGTFASPGIFEVMAILGKEETIRRMKDVR
jgi:glutamyl-tRNA synthetase